MKLRYIEIVTLRFSPLFRRFAPYVSRFPLHRRNSTFLQKDRLSPVFFAYLSVSPPSRKVLRFFGSVADDLLFGSIPDTLLFGSFLTSLIILFLLLLTGQNVFSSLHETSIRRKLWRVAPCKSHPFHSSLDLDIIAKRQVVTCLFCLSVGFSSFPKSSAILFGNIPDDLLFGIFSILSTTPALDNLFSPCLFAFLSAAPILPKNAVCWETPFIAAL